MSNFQQIFGTEFGLSPGPISLQMLAPLIGGILGQLFAGVGSDIFVNWMTTRRKIRVPEYRLMLVYPGFILAIAGLLGENWSPSTYYH